VIDLIRNGPRGLSRVMGPALVIGLLLVLVTACTGGAAGNNGAGSNGVATLNSASPGASAAPSASLNPQDALLAYARCMREHGIDMPDPQFDETNGNFQVQIGVNGSKVDKQKMEAAEQACHHFMDGVAFGGNGGQIDQETQDALLAFAACMREHGIDFPDPQFEDGGRVKVGGPAQGPGFDPETQDFKDAQEACRSKLPGGGKDFGFSTGKEGGEGPSTNSGSQP
jgi:hypothetical protein